MLKKLLIALCVALAPVISMAAAKNTASTTTPINSIAAIVNSEVITTVELAKQQAFFAANLQASHTELPPEDVLRNQVLDQMIDQNLQLQIAKQNGIQVDDTDVTAAVKNIATKNGKTIAEMYASVRPMGLTPAAFRDEIRKELIINKLQEQQVASKITITPEEVADYLNSNAGQSLDTIEYHLGDILVTFPSGAPTAAQINETKQKAQDILANIKKGADFQTVAVANSKGDNALQGGDLGWRQLLQMPSVFASQAIHMQTGDVAGPIYTENGFYILKLLGTRSQDKNKAKAMTPTELKETVENLIFQRKLQERLQTWVIQLRSSAYIKILNQ